MTHASLFSGIGGPEVAAAMLGWRNVFHCDINPFGRAVLDYWFPDSESYGDIKKTDFSKWGGQVDVLTGGFPCQPFSYAGQRRGSDDDRYLWPQFKRVIEEIRPTWVIGENVAGITTMVEQGEIAPMASQATLFDEGDGVRGYRCEQSFTIERVCSDLEGLGYEVQPLLIPACAVGAPHRRDRVFIVGCRIVANAHSGHDGRGTGEDESKSREEWLQERDKVRQPGESGQVRREGEGYAFANSGIKGLERKNQSRSSERRERVYLRGNSAGCDMQDSTKKYASDTSHARRCGENQSWNKEADKRMYIRRAFAGFNIQITAGEYAPNSKNPDISDTKSEQSERMRFEQPENSGEGQKQFGRGIGEDCNEIAGCGRWDAFPTVSPIHRGNDGIPFPLDDLTISPAQWRTESLKAYGNAIVPQVMYEIFRAIENIIKQQNLWQRK